MDSLPDITMSPKANKLLSLGLKISFLGLLISYFAAAFTDQLGFSLWEQVNYIREMNNGDFFWTPDHPHFLRYLLVYPVFALADYFNGDANLYFSLVIALAIFFTAFITNKTIASFYAITDVSFFTLIVFAALSLFMNGRIIFALLAMSWFLYLFIRWHFGRDMLAIKLFFPLLLILFLSSVSTGTFSVIYMLIIYWGTIIIYRSILTLTIKPADFELSIILLVVLSLFAPFFFIYLNKNLLYFGGGFQGVINMLEHGAGKLITRITIYKFTAFAPLVLLTGVFICKAYCRFFGLRPLIVAILASLFGGLFGFSTMVVLIPPLLILTISAMYNLFDFASCRFCSTS